MNWYHIAQYASHVVFSSNMYCWKTNVELQLSSQPVHFHLVNVKFRHFRNVEFF
jgi:hypothetical protein